jgi:beta-fructofuranosidase
MQPHSNPAIQRAMQSLAEATPNAATDPARPVYHFRPPALWMNDPNGVIFHKGYYHLFYQHNPYGDDWGHMHWGHARSGDLVHWEHLPIALWPSLDKNEEHVFSGCAAIDGEGRPLLFYTSVHRASEQRPPNEQWAAIGDPELITWQKHPANPILSLANHGGPAFEGDWRDPFIFDEAGRTFLVLAGNHEETAGVALYEATGPTLVNWRYCGLLYQKPRSERAFLECPNFVKIQDKWILLTSPYLPVEYITGAFHIGTLSFTPVAEGVLDPGASDVPNYYATNILFDGQGRCILFGWVRGFAKGRGWNGCLALPRILTIGDDWRPRQQPIPELQALRGRHHSLSGMTISNGGHVLEDVKGDTLEIQAVIDISHSQAAGLKIAGAVDGSQAALIRYDGRTLHVAGVETSLALPAGAPLQLHLFVDKSVLEVFVGDGATCVTRVIEPPAGELGIEVFSAGGSALVESLDAWEMGSIW